MKLGRYTKNLRVEGSKVYSYSTHVATISGSKLLVHGYWSVTTSRHVNHVASTHGLTKVESPRDSVEAERKAEEEKGLKDLRMIAGVAKLGDVFGTTPKEKNDWKARMLKAGLEG